MRRQRYNSGERSASLAPERPGGVAVGCAALIRTYQLVLRPLVPPSCRFAPSCSEYARTAILTHGVLRGGLLSARRIGRCNAWYRGGFDPVPEIRG